MKPTKISSLSALLLMLLLALGVLAPAAQASRSLGDVLENYEGYDWNYITNRAAWQAQNDGPLYPSAPPTVPQYETFEGSFTPQGANTKIAIFSDDGCDVYINGAKVHSKLGSGQGLPDLGQSLHKIAYIFQSGVSYQIKVVYSNVHYTGNTDIDGATLFAYSETGVKELQYRLDAQSPFAAVPSPLVVPLGQSVEFRAMPDPVNATVWPDGKPAWSGSSGASGSGETISVTFNTLSTGATDYKTVSVECGNTITANVIVYTLTIKARRTGSGDAFNTGAIKVAAGNKSTNEHKADLLVQSAPAMAGIAVGGVTIKSGGLGGTSTVTATASLNSTTTNSNGQIGGSFTSGHRAPTTTVVEFDANPDPVATTLSTLSFNQVWNQTEYNSWDYSGHWSYNEPYPCVYNMAFNGSQPITELPPEKWPDR